MGVKVISMSLLLVCVTPTLGVRLSNFRRCWGQPRLKQCTSMQFAHSLQGKPPLLYLLR